MGRNLLGRKMLFVPPGGLAALAAGAGGPSCPGRRGPLQPQSRRAERPGAEAGGRLAAFATMEKGARCRPNCSA